MLSARASIPDVSTHMPCQGVKAHMRTRDLTSYLGEMVHVVIDRPLDTDHARHPDLRYPVNYGYLQGAISGDGAPIDAYVLGVGQPVATFAGVVVAIVVRADDVEDKLAVAPPGRTIPRDEIAAVVAFQEQFFASSIVTAQRPGNEVNVDARATPCRRHRDHHRHAG